MAVSERLFTDSTGQQIKASLNDIATALRSLTSDIDKIDWDSYWKSQRTGKVYGILINGDTVTKLGDNAGLAVPTPSTDSVQGNDPYNGIPLFTPIEVNAHVTGEDDAQGAGYHVIDSVRGMTDFSRKTADTYMMFMPWYIKQDVTGIWITDTPTDGFEPYKAAVNPDGSVAPFMLFAKYPMSLVDNVPMSVSGQHPWAFTISHNTQITQLQTYKGNQYCGMTGMDLLFIQLYFLMKYATLDSQSVMAGCTSYNYQYKCAVAESGVKRVLLTQANAANMVVGSTVMVGEQSSNTNNDRGQSYNYNITQHAKILSKETVNVGGTDYTALNLDLDSTITTTTTTLVSTIHWMTGSTDNVLGLDGSPVDNTSGKYPCRIGGIELFVGGYEVLGNVVMDITNTSGIERNVYVCDDCLDLSITLDLTKYELSASKIPGGTGSWRYIKTVAYDLDNGISVPTDLSGTSSTYYKDGIYTDTNTSGQKEWLAFGLLNNGAAAGLWILNANNTLTNARWNILGRLF